MSCLVLYLAVQFLSTWTVYRTFPPALVGAGIDCRNGSRTNPDKVTVAKAHIGRGTETLRRTERNGTERKGGWWWCGRGVILRSVSITARSR